MKNRENNYQRLREMGQSSQRSDQLTGGGDRRILGRASSSDPAKDYQRLLNAIALNSKYLTTEEFKRWPS